MEHITSENLAIFLLAGFSALNLFKQGVASLQTWYEKNNLIPARVEPSRASSVQARRRHFDSNSMG